MSDIKDKYLQVSMNDYLRKPFKIVELIKTLTHWVQKNKIALKSYLNVMSP